MTTDLDLRLKNEFDIHDANVSKARKEAKTLAKRLGVKHFKQLDSNFGKLSCCDCYCCKLVRKTDKISLSVCLPSFPGQFTFDQQ